MKHMNIFFIVFWKNKLQKNILTKVIQIQSYYKDLLFQEKSVQVEWNVI